MVSLGWGFLFVFCLLSQSFVLVRIFSEGCVFVIFSTNCWLTRPVTMAAYWFLPYSPWKAFSITFWGVLGLSIMALRTSGLKSLLSFCNVFGGVFGFLATDN